ncbi:MAG TPA: CBS domain-containing protein [Gemmatimonadales bacterium]|jgi:CBS domain-containing protein|nr:CBS domain-containing protein [Gemmatimonadales bacterium]
MRVAELMQTEVQTVPFDGVVNDAVVTLADSHISALPVVDRAGRMVGVISSTDILASEEEAEDQTARETLFEGTLVRDVMTPRPLTIAPDADVKEAAQQMLYADVHRLFVTDGDRLIGVISTSDIMRAVAAGQL